MDVSLADMRRLVRDPRVVVLDVRSREAYTAGHLPGAINIAVQEMRERAPAELRDLDRAIAVYCGGPS